MHDFPSQLFQFSTDHPHHYPIMAGIQPIRGFLKIDLQEGAILEVNTNTISNLWTVSLYLPDHSSHRFLLSLTSFGEAILPHSQF